jgi:3-isopropylmalate dehydrogenase
MSSISGAHNVAVIPGDLNGRTVTSTVMSMIPALEPLLSKPLSIENYPYSIEYFEDNDIQELGAKELEELAQHDAIFLGAVGDPHRKHVKVETGILLAVRKAYDQYVNLRPVVLPEGVKSPLAGKDHRYINFEVCRENTEGLYAKRGRIDMLGTPRALGVQEMVCTHEGVTRLVEYACERALQKEGDPRVHIVHKTNVLNFAGPVWDQVYEEFKPRNDVEVLYMHVDACVAAMVTQPEQFHVIATGNMFGDIITDLGAALQGGMYVAVSGNLNPTGAYPSMFEPVHGTAPDLWYDQHGVKDDALVQKVKPEAAMLSFAMMLEHLSEPIAAAALKDAALVNLRDPRHKEMGLDELTIKAYEHISAAGNGGTSPAGQ